MVIQYLGVFHCNVFFFKICILKLRRVEGGLIFKKAFKIDYIQAGTPRILWNEGRHVDNTQLVQVLAKQMYINNWWNKIGYNWCNQIHKDSKSYAASIQIGDAIWWKCLCTHKVYRKQTRVSSEVCWNTIVWGRMKRTGEDSSSFFVY
jgi:hypothetical protein